MNTINNRFAHLCFDEHIQLGAIVWLAAEDIESPSDNFTDNFADLLPKQNKELFGFDVAPKVEDNDEAARVILSRLRDERRDGFLVLVFIPQKEPLGGGTTRVHCGHLTAYHLYTEAFDDAFVDRVAAVSKRHTRDCARAFAKEKKGGAS